jgi:hypothetical protein
MSVHRTTIPTFGTVETHANRKSAYRDELHDVMFHGDDRKVRHDSSHILSPLSLADAMWTLLHYGPMSTFHGSSIA